MTPTFNLSLWEVVTFFALSGVLVMVNACAAFNFAPKWVLILDAIYVVYAFWMVWSLMADYLFN